MKNKKHNKLHKYNRTLCSVALSSALAVVAVGSALPMVAQASESVGVATTTGRTLYVGDNVGANGSGQHFQELRDALTQASSGDTIVLTSNFVHREVGTEGLQIPKNVTIDGNGYTLSIRASKDKGISMHGDLTLKNLTLNISGESNTPGGVIDVGGHHLTIENVSTADNTGKNARPEIKAGTGGHAHITIIGGTDDSRFDSITVGSDAVDIEIQSQYAQIDKDINLSGARNVSLSLKNAKPLTISGLGDKGSLKKLTLDNTKVTIRQNLDIETLELKNEAKFNVKSIPDPEGYSNDTNFNVKVTTLKTDGKTNTLDIAGKSSINVDALDGDPSDLNVTGIANNFKLKDNSKYDYVPNGTHGEFLPSVDELPPEETPPAEEEKDKQEQPNDAVDTNTETGENTDTTSEDGKKPDSSVNGNDKAQGGDTPAADDPAAEPKDEVTGGSEGKPEEPKKENEPASESDKEGANKEEANNDSSSSTEGSSSQPADLPKPAEKSIKERIMDTLKGLFIRNNLNEKQQQQVAEKTEESLKDLASAYADYDFIFSLDAARVTENRLNDLSMLNGLESASIDNYAFLAQSARALKARNSVWVSTSIGQQRGDSKRRSHSINLGYDEQFGNLLFGTFVSYLHQKGERGELSSKLHGYAFNIYAKYNQDAHEVIGLLNVGRSKAHLQRNISALGVSNQADAKGKFVGLRVEYGYRMPFEQYGLQVKPLVGLSYNLGRQAAFTEHGTVMPVHVGKIKAQRLSLEAGVELKKYFETAYIYAKPMIQTDLMARSNDVDVRFVDTPNSIPFKSTAKKKTYFALSLGTQVQLRKNLLLDLNANSRIGNNERDIQGSVKLGYKF